MSESTSSLELAERFAFEEVSSSSERSDDERLPLAGLLPPRLLWLPWLPWFELDDPEPLYCCEPSWPEDWLEDERFGFWLMDDEDSSDELPLEPWAWRDELAP